MKIRVCDIVFAHPDQEISDNIDIAFSLLEKPGDFLDAIKLEGIVRVQNGNPVTPRVANTVVARCGRTAVLLKAQRPYPRVASR